MSRRVAVGSSRASPPATVRTAPISWGGSTPFSKNPLAPARIAPNTYSSRSKVVKTITLVSVRRESAVIRALDGAGQRELGAAHALDEVAAAAHAERLEVAERVVQ